MRAGELDRLIVIEYQLTTVTNGAQTVDWLPLVATGSPPAAVPLWASFKDVPPSRSEAVRQGLLVGRNQSVVTIRWRGDVTSAMRIKEYLVSEIIYQIVGGPSMIGRKQWLEMVVERFSL
jgi:head-tail adaptor